MRALLRGFLLLFLALFFSGRSSASSGNFLGSIVVPSGQSANNKNTSGTPFTIPFGTPRIAFVIDNAASGYNFRTGTGSGLAATTSDLNQKGPATIQITLNTGSGAEQVLAIFSATGGTVNVFQLDGPAQSAVVPIP